MEKMTLNELARMRKLAGINESFGGVDANDGAQIMQQVGLSPEEAAMDAAEVAAEQGVPPLSAEEIALHVAEFAKSFEFLKAQGVIKPEYLNPIGEGEDLDESIDSQIRKAKKTFITACLALGVYVGVLHPLANAFGFDVPDMSHITHDIFQIRHPDGGYNNNHGGF